LLSLLVIASAVQPAYAQTGQPVLSGSIPGQGTLSSGTFFADFRLTNTGSGPAENIRINQLPVRTLAGTGTVTYDAALSPALPIAAGDLAAGAFTTIRLYFSVPSTVTRFSITENGTLQDAAQTTLNFSMSQSIIPRLNRAPVVNAGPDLTITMPDAAALNGTVTDDGLPTGSTLTITWSKVSGPGTVTFVNASAASTTAAFSQTGQYVLRLTASDTQFSSFDDVAVTVNAPNQPPVVNAGPDVAVSLPDAAALNGTVTDDGLPAGSPLTITWSKFSGPGSVTFANANAASTTATFSQTGTYVLRLSASDTVFTSSDDVTVTVNPRPNGPPRITSSAIRTFTLQPAQNSPQVVGLGPWTAQQYDLHSQGSANWVKDATNTSVTQVVNSDASFLLGDFNFSNAQIEGTWSVNTPTDDDYIGFGFGYQDSQHFYLFDWKQSDQGDPLGFAERGMSVKVFNANSPLTGSDFWPSGGNGARVRTIYHNTIQWAHFTEYKFKLRFRPGEIKITVSQGTTVLADFTVNDTTYTNGKFGFYNYSQEQVRYAGFTRTSLLQGTYNYDVEATDPDNDTLTYSLPTGPAGMSIDPATGLLQWPVTGSDLGDHAVTVRVQDPGGLFDTQPYTLTIVPANQAPVVNAGPDLTITLPAGATLNGTVTDDGLPAGATLTIGWSKFSGPGTVTFGNAASASTTASFSQAGTYVLRLTAGDTEFTASDDVTVTVNAANLAPLVSAGSDLTITLPNSATLNGTVTDDGLPVGSTLTITWSKFSGPGTVTFTNPNAASTTASFTQAGTYVLRLSANDTQFPVSDDVTVTVNAANIAPAVNAGPDQTITLPNNATLNGTVTDDGLPVGATLTITWSKVSGPGTVTFANADAASTTATFSQAGTYVLRLSVSDTQLTTSDEVTVTVNPPNIAPAVNAGPDLTVNLPDCATLNGTVTDDGLPVGATLTITWSKSSGPGTVTFANANAASTTACFSASGTYVLRLTASDTQQNSSDDVTVTVNPGNLAPVVNAGPDLTVTQPNAAALNGSVLDDGLPVGATLTITWSKFSGPGTVTFVNANAASTSATFSQSGTYVLRLTASDSQVPSFDDVTVTVNPATNLPPAVNAGPDQTVTLPGRATLNGSVTDDGLPAGNTLVISWTKFSGPGNVTFTAPNAASTLAGFSAAGTYVLRLTGDDGQFSRFDEVQVQVSGAPPTPPTVPAPSSPANGTEVKGPVDVIGTVNSASLDSWTLEYKMVEDPAYRPIATGTTNVSNAKLGTFDPTLVLNGTVLLRLRATDTTGQTTTTQISLIVSGDQKVGKFSVSFRDLSVPMAGFPIDIVRTYDSRLQRSGDFGVGWTLDIKSVQLSENQILGSDWQETRSGGFFPNYCLVETKPHIVTVTTQDGAVYKFRPTLTPECQQFVPITGVTINFQPLTGTNASLSVGAIDVLVAGSIPGAVQLLDLSTVDLVDPNAYTFSLPDGRSMQINQPDGLQSLRDSNGNQITIGPGGLTHSAGKSVLFQRDAFGRITRITDPAGNALNYAYDLRGDLTTFTDQENNATGYLYNNTHGVLEIRDPRGIQPIRNEYDDGGRLIRSIDAFGNVVTYTHNVGTRQELITDRLGNVTLHEYDTAGNVVQTTDSLGGVTLRTYDARNNMLTERNPGGQAKTFTYDAQDNRLTETDPVGNILRFTYNARRQVLTVTDPRGGVTTNTYDANGNLTSTRDPLGNTSSYIYGSQGLPTSITNPLGGVTQYQYDGGGHMTRQVDPLGNVMTFTYDANGNRLSETKTRTTPVGPETLVTAFQYDHLNRLIQTTSPDGSTTQIAYNSIGKQSATTDPLGRQTTYTYDLMGRLSQTTYADGTFEASTYDAEGRRLTSVDRAGRATSFQHDSLGRTTRTTLPDGSSATAAFDSAGQVTQSTDERGNISRFTYDAAGRRTGVTDSLNNTTTFSYDGDGNQISSTDARGNTTQFQYDSTNRRTRLTYPDTTFEATAYDALGRQISKTDQAGRTTQFQYDALSRLTRVTDALAQATDYTYDDVSNRLTQTDAAGKTTRLEYDRLGRLTRRTLPLGMSETSVYDAAGNLIRKTDFNGRTTSYSYDVMHRLLAKTPDPGLAEPPISFTYTSTSQRASMNDASGATTYQYDSRDRLIQKATPQGSLAYTYDAHGNVTSIRSSNANGTSVDYTYDVLNRLSAVRDNRLTAGTTTYSYDAAGNLNSFLYPNGVQHAYTYNTLNRLTNVNVGTGAGTLASYAYTLGPAGNRTSVLELGGRHVAYSYDALYRLTNEAIAGSANPTLNGSIGYTYDSVGNRLQRTSTVGALPSQNFSYDPNDRLATDSYDSNGNTIASAADSFTYDFENELKTRNGGTVTLVYDGDGNRVAKTAGGITTRFLIDNVNPTGLAQVIEELTGGTVQRTYTFGLTLLSQNQAGVARFYGYDGLGSVRLLTDPAGAPTDAYHFDAFGVILSSIGTTPNNHLFRGEYFDFDLNLYYLRARYYKDGTGRFMTTDPLDGVVFDPASLHRYLYALVNPVNNLDPTGQFSMGEMSISIGIQNVLTTMAISAPLRALEVAMKVAAGADLGAAVQDGLIGLAQDVAVGAIIGGVFEFAPRLVALRSVGQAVQRAANSVWNLAPFARGRAIEELILRGAPNVIRTPNFPVIDHFWQGIATSIKSIDATAASYQSAGSLISRLSGYARSLSQAGVLRQGALTVDLTQAAGRNLVIAFENGAMTVQQAQAVRQFVQTASRQFPNIRVVLQFIP